MAEPAPCPEALAFGLTAVTSFFCYIGDPKNSLIGDCGLGHLKLKGLGHVLAQDLGQLRPWLFWHRPSPLVRSGRP